MEAADWVAELDFDGVWSLGSLLPVMQRGDIPDVVYLAAEMGPNQQENQQDTKSH